MKVAGIIILVLLVGSAVWYYKDWQYKEKGLAYGMELKEKKLEAERIEKARLDSIRKVRELEKRFDFAEKAVKEIAKKYMNDVTPNTGTKLQWGVDRFESSYNDLTKTATIAFHVNWYGKTGLFVLDKDPLEQLVFTAKLLVMEDFSVKLTDITRNSPLIKAEASTELMSKGKQLLAEKITETVSENLKGSDKKK